MTLSVSSAHRDDSLDAGIAPTAADATLGLRQCALLNISVCEATVEASSEGRGFGCGTWSSLLRDLWSFYLFAPTIMLIIDVVSKRCPFPGICGRHMVFTARHLQ